MKKLIIFFFFLHSFYSFCQEVGTLFKRNYSPKEYQADSQNWSIVEDKRGVMYFANDKGVLEYDGINWETIPIKNGSAVHSLSMDSSGVIYVGASGEFGYLEPDSMGEMQYHSLVDKLPEKDRKFADVWTTIAINNEVYFQTDNFVLRLSTNGAKVWYPKRDSFFFLCFYANNKLYVHDFLEGIKVLEEDNLKLTRAGGVFKQKKIYTILPYNDNELIVGLRSKGLVLFNPVRDTTFRIFENEAQNFLIQNKLYNGKIINNDLLAIATRKGVVILNKQGEVKYTFNKNYGLRDENIRGIFQDKHGVLWLGLDNGLSRVELRSPIRFLGEENGIKGAIYDVIQLKEKIYLATSEGVFCLNGNQAKLLSNSPITQCWKFLKVDESLLIVSTNEGIYEIEEESTERIVKTTSEALTLSIALDKKKHKSDKHIWVGQKLGLSKLSRIDGNWVLKDSIVNLPHEIHSILEYKKGRLWIGTFFNGLFHYNLETQKLDRYDDKNGLPNLRDLHVYKIGDKLLFSSSKGIFTFNEESKIFQRDTLSTSFLADNTHGVFDLKADSQGNIWMADFYTKNNPIGAALKIESGFLWENRALRRLPEIIKPVLYINEQDNLWIGGNQGLFRFDTKYKKNYNQKFFAILRKVKAGNNTVLINGNQFKNLENHFLGVKRVLKPNIVNEKQILQYNNNSILFEFVAPYFEEESNIEYSTFLEGFNNRWSRWSKGNKKEYSGLSEGIYTFRVKARNTFGIESEEVVFYFEILPPWYRSFWAKILYFVLAIFLIWFVARVYNYRIIKQNKLLEQSVAIRTRELELQKDAYMIQATNLQEANEEISVMIQDLNEKNELIEEKRAEITDSINYASRIQGAILPSLEFIQERLPNSFILYKPRDIVSGDFYWFSETEPEPLFGLQMTPEGRQPVFKGFTSTKQIISAVDCTGHGVPGAFMSMIGEILLKQIITSEGIISPDRILNELHKKIRVALNQEDGENRDGMDMTICMIDYDKKIIEFAGARNPIIYVQNNELKKINGDIYPIGGGSYGEGRERIFTKHEIPLVSDTAFYLFSDGFQDQFGGPKGKKFMKGKFHKLLYNNHHLPMSEQKQLLDQSLIEWMKDEEQVDDIVVIGVLVKLEE